MYDFTFNPDNTLLISGNNDGTIGLWNIMNSRLLAKLPAHHDHIDEIVFNENSNHLVSLSSETEEYHQQIKVWDLKLDIEYLLVQGCEWLQDYLKHNPNVSDEDRAVCDDILGSAK